MQNRATAAAGDDLLMVAGEASGDLHGARLLTELEQLRPGVRAFGLGSDELRRAGFDAVAESSEISVVGLTEALRILPRARRIFHRLLAEVDRRGARVAVLVDSPDFNLPLARRLRQRGCRVVYYVSPQVWAWRRGRVRKIARRVDKMLVLFPFEVGFYASRGIDVVHVGHPLVDEVPVRPQAWETDPEPQRYRVALLPGSRESEIRALMPSLLDGAARLAGSLEVDLSLIQAPTISDDLLREVLENAPAIDLRVVREDRMEAIADAHLAICASGTATLQTGLLGTPMLVVYKVGRWTYRAARMLVRIDNVSLVNLVLGREVVPELIQDDARGERIAVEARALLLSRDRVSSMRSALSELRGRLGASGASRRAAVEVASMMGVEEER